MVASKQKKPKYKEAPKTQKNAAIANSPEQYYGENPSWRFSTIDIKMWSLVNDSVQKIFWNEILPKLQGWESQNWKEILLDAKKHNHSIDIAASLEAVLGIPARFWHKLEAEYRDTILKVNAENAKTDGKIAGKWVPNNYGTLKAAEV